MDIAVSPDITRSVTYGDRWPALVWVLETSKYMKLGLLGSATTPAHSVIVKLMTEYSQFTFPVRWGLVTYKSYWTKTVSLRPTTATFPSTITYIFSNVSPSGESNAADGLKRAASVLGADKTGGARFIVLASASTPNKALGCKDNTACCINRALAEAGGLRRGYKADLFTVEIRRAKYEQAITKFLTQAAGKAGSDGGYKSMHHVVQSTIGVKAFLTALTRSTCAFGPLPATGVSPKKVTVHLQYKNIETAIPQVVDRDNAPAAGFEYAIKGKGAHVILTMKSCSDLGVDSARRLLVRW